MQLRPTLLLMCLAGGCAQEVTNRPAATVALPAAPPSNAISGVMAVSTQAPALLSSAAAGAALNPGASAVLRLIAPAAPKPAAAPLDVGRSDGHPESGPFGVAQGREVEGGKNASDLMRRLEWQALPDGSRRTELVVEASDAKGLRVALMIEALPMSAVLTVQSSMGGTRQVFSGGQVLASLQQVSGPAPGVLGQFWTPLSAGNEQVLTIALPAGIDASGLWFSVPRVSAFFR